MRYIISALFGLAVGSFANVCILRLPKDASLWFPRSRCTQCGKSLKSIHNIPLLSYAFLRGRCYFCRTVISWQYPLIEALMAALFLFHARFFAGSLKSLLIADVLSFYLVAISLIDYRHRIIPDELSFSLAAIGLLVSFSNPYLSGSPGLRFLHSLSAALGGGLLMFLLAYAGQKAFHKEALGGGDIKLVAASAAVLGWAGIVGPLLLGSLLGGGVALGLLLLKKKKLGETLPFGPFLSFGTYITCLFPDWWQWLFKL